VGVELMLFVTSRCGYRCGMCGQGCWRGSVGLYDMGLDELGVLVGACGGVGVSSVVVTGGEPLLWPLLVEGVRFLRGFFGDGCCFSLLSSGFGGLSGEVVGLFDRVVVSVYGFSVNRGELLGLRGRFGRKVRLKFKDVFNVWPDGFVVGSVPGRCFCGPFTVCGGRVGVCGQVFEIGCRFGVDVGGLVTDVSVGWLGRLGGGMGGVGRGGFGICGFCIENSGVNRVCGRVANK